MLSLLRLYVYTLLQNYRERVSRRHFGMINYTKSCWKWLLTTLSREKIHGKSAWKRLINLVCWQTTSTGAILNAKSEVKWSNWQVTQNHKTIEYLVCFVACDKLFVTDGIWKLRYPVCTHKVPMVVQGCPLRHYLDCCTGEPVHGKPFCWNHAGREQWCTTVHTIAITSITMLYIM